MFGRVIVSSFTLEAHAQQISLFKNEAGVQGVRLAVDDTAWPHFTHDMSMRRFLCECGLNCLWHVSLTTRQCH